MTVTDAELEEYDDLASENRQLKRKLAAADLLTQAAQNAVDADNPLLGQQLFALDAAIRQYREVRKGKE